MQLKLRAEASQLQSLDFFKTDFMSLSSPHPLWLTSTQNPYEINKAVVQARMLSGRYRTEALCRFWSSNPNGFCLLPACSELQTKEDVTHMLITCPSISATRNRLRTLLKNFSTKHPVVFPAVSTFLDSSDSIFQTQFIIDCSTIPEIIRLK